MFEWIFRWLKNTRGRPDLFTARMPEVDVTGTIEEVFRMARESANDPTRRVVIVTPGRLLMFQPCPAPGGMSAAQVANIEMMISRKVKRNIAVIGYNELQAVRTDVTKAIPFIGILLGFAYIGHSVWLFEGHVSALEAGCRDADVLLVDGDMIAHLSPHWQGVVSRVMRRPEIYVHDRATFSLRRAGRTSP
jgi:hypothetical protein